MVDGASIEGAGQSEPFGLDQRIAIVRFGGAEPREKTRDGVFGIQISGGERLFGQAAQRGRCDRPQLGKQLHAGFPKAEFAIGHAPGRLAPIDELSAAADEQRVEDVVDDDALRREDAVTGWA